MQCNKEASAYVTVSLQGTVSMSYGSIWLIVKWLHLHHLVQHVT